MKSERVREGVEGYLRREEKGGSSMLVRTSGIGWVMCIHKPEGVDTGCQWTY